MKLGTINLGHIVSRIREGHVTRHPIAEGVFSAGSMFAIIVLGTMAAHQESLNTLQLAAVVEARAIHVLPPTIEAASAIIFDAKTGEVLYEKNANKAQPLASLTKLMSAEAVLSVASLTSTVAITQEDLAPEGDSGLRVGDIWTLKNLLTFGLIVSSNDAMAAAAAVVGTSSIIGKMNAQAQVLGLSHMHFNNPTGLDIDVEADEAGAYGSARDMALLAADFLKKYPELFASTVVPQTTLYVEGQVVEATPTASPILDIPGLLGAKTGYTDLAGGNLVAAFDLEVGHPAVVVVLGSSVDGRFSDVRILIEAAREAIRNK